MIAARTVPANGKTGSGGGSSRTRLTGIGGAVIWCQL
jgi:hypothetical protein